MYTNINSLRNKVHNLEWESTQFSYNIDIISLTETCLGPEINMGELSMVGYELFRNDRNMHGGGIAVYVSNDFKTDIINLQSQSEALLLKLSNRSCTLFFLTIYRPPNNNDPLLIPLLLDEVNELIDLETSVLFVCGDFNFPQIDWEKWISTGRYNLCNPFLYKISELGLDQHIFSPTHRLGNILDLVMTNKAIVNNINIIDSVLSDHSIVVSELNLNISCLTVPGQHDIKIYQYSKFDSEKAQALFYTYEKEILESIDTNKDINFVYNLLIQGLNNIREICVPSKTLKTTKQPGWFSNKIRNALKKQKKLYNTAKHCKSDYNTNRYKLVQKQNKKLIIYAKKSYLTKTLYKPLQNGDSKAFYKHIRQSRENSSNIIPNLNYQNKVAETSIDKANMLNTFFQSIFTEDDGLLLPLPNKKPSIEDINVTVTPAGVLKLLNDIDISKSCGTDNITGIHLKTFSHLIASTVAHIFNYSLASGSLPDIWREARVTAIHKKGSRHLPNNYRPVSLTCIMCKLLEHIIARHIHDFLEVNNILVESQHGFRGGRSCDTQLVYTVNDLAYNRERGAITDVIILDFSKAFDTVSHQKLLYKLSSFGLNDKLVDWLKGFLQNRGQVVKVEAAVSSRCCVSSGVPQGSVLGPLLFLIFVNDLTDQISSECRLFADDALLYNTRDKAHILQEDLNTLEVWSRAWQLSFNIAKCSVLSIKDSKLEQIYYLNNQRLKNVNSHPYLGIELSYDLKWTVHLNKIIAKSTRLLGMLYRVLKSADTRTRQLAYHTLIRPILEYGCPAWDPYLEKDIKQLEKLQNKAIRFVFRLRGQISFTEIKRKANITSLKDRRKNLRINLFCKSISSGVIKDTHNQPPERLHNTRQQEGLYVPVIKTKAFFNSFWPRTTRDIREGI